MSTQTQTATKKTPEQYAAELAKYGREERLARVVRPATFKEINEGENKGSKMIYLNLAFYDTKTKKTEFHLASYFLRADKVGTPLEAYYAGLEKGQLLSVQFKINGKYMNIFQTFPRTAKKGKTAVAEAAPVEVVAETVADPEL